MRFVVIAAICAGIYLFCFGILFGSPQGVMGDLVHWDMNTKTKILNVLAVFGYLALGAAAVIGLRTSTSNSEDLVGILLLVLFAVGFGLSFVDCAVFVFCEALP